MTIERLARALTRACSLPAVPFALTVLLASVLPGQAQDKKAVWSQGGALTFVAAPPAVQAAVKASLSGGGAKPATTPAKSKSKPAAASSKPKVAGKSKSKSKGVKVASLGGGAEFAAKTKPKKSLSGGGGVQWVASAKCLAANLRAVVYHVAKHYGSVRVNSTCRSKGHNRKVGGASKSWHLTGNAVDLRVFGNVGGAAAYLRTAAGGYKNYGGGLFHIDNGPRRTW